MSLTLADINDLRQTNRNLLPTQRLNKTKLSTDKAGAVKTHADARPFELIIRILCDNEL